MKKYKLNTTKVISKNMYSKQPFTVMQQATLYGYFSDDIMNSRNQRFEVMFWSPLQ